MSAHTPESASPPKVVIVNGNPNLLLELETMFEARKYDVVFVESYDKHPPHLQIQEIQPNWVIVCIDSEDTVTFAILIHLCMDKRTKNIPLEVVWMTSNENTGINEKPAKISFQYVHEVCH